MLLGLGALVLLVSWAPKGLKQLPLSLAMICVGLGFGLFALDVIGFDPDPRTLDGLTGDVGDSERLWAITGFIILTSILVHGVTSTPLMALIERLGGRSLQGEAAPANPPPRDEQLG